jgi:hypothetical protein
MKKKLLLLTLIITLTSGLNVPSLAAVNEEASMAGFQSIDIPPSPRQIAMGYAGTALSGPGFSYFNPASPAITGRPLLTLGVAPLPFDYTVAFAEGSWAIDNLFFGANVSNHFIDKIWAADYRGVNYNLPGSDDFSAVSLCFGFQNEALGLGIVANGLQERIFTSTAYGLSLSLGLTYWLIPQKFVLGAAVLHMGTTTGFLEETKNFGQGAPLPRSGRAGLAYSDSLFNIGYTVTGDLVYRDVGGKIMSLSQVMNRMTVPLGIEVRPTSFIDIRVGKRLNDETEIITFGAAVRYSMLALDMAFVIQSYVGDVDFSPYLSLTYSIEPPKAVAAPARKKTAVPVIIQEPAEVKAAPQEKVQPVKNDSTSAPHTAPFAPEQSAPGAVPVPAVVPATAEKAESTTAPAPVNTSPAPVQSDSAKALPLSEPPEQ